MILYEFCCGRCALKWEEMLPIEHRDLPTTLPCKRCGEYEVWRVPPRVSFSIHEGACGNAANGYSSTIGDCENWKARDRGEKEPYKK